MVVLGMDIKDPELPPPTLNLGHQKEQARLDKDYKTADSLREQIEELGVKINDKARTWAAGPLVRLYTRPKPCDRVVMRPPCVIVCQAGGEGHRC